MDYETIISDPYNPIKIEKGVISFPSWLTKDTFTIEDFQERINWSLTDHAVWLHASFYDATVWYPWIEKYTMPSVFISLNEDEVHDLIYEQTLPKEKEELVKRYLKTYQFVKSSKKSSHYRKKVKNYDAFIEEITHPDVIKSFKNGCRNIFMREYISGIINEFRVYVYKNAIRYVECYVKTSNIDEKTTNELLEYVRDMSSSVRYEDYVLDVAEVVKGDLSRGFMCIEINTPLYLFAGLNHSDYYFERDNIHTAETPILRGMMKI